MSICSWAHQDPCMIVRIGDIEAVSNGPTYGYGLVSIDGWEGGAPATGGPVPYEAGDGAIRGDVFYGPRSLIIEGDIVAVDHQDLADKIGALSALGRYETLTVDETFHTGWVRQMDVTRLRPVQITPHGPTYATWTMSLETVDWRRVEPDIQVATVTTAGTPIRNLGTAPAALTLHLNGPLTNPGIAWGGGAWRYSGSIPSGQMISVDMERRVVRNPATTAHSRRLASGTWLSPLPGLTTLWRTGTGSGTVTARWRSSWA